MKRIICVLLALLTILFCAGCSAANMGMPTSSSTSSTATVPSSSSSVPTAPTQGDPQPAVPLTFEEIMAIPNYYSPALDYIVRDETLQDVVDWLEEYDISAAFIKGTCVDVQYYVTWEDRWTHWSYIKYTFVITEIAQKYSGFELEVNDIVQVKQLSNMEPSNKNDMIAFFESHGATVDADAENYLGMNIQNGDYELIPVRGVEYEKENFFDEPPMCVGESYTFLLTMEQGELNWAYYVLPTDDNSHLIVNDYYDLQFTDYYFPIATEIAQLFTEENEQE